MEYDERDRSEGGTKPSLMGDIEHLTLGIYITCADQLLTDRMAVR